MSARRLLARLGLAAGAAVLALVAAEGVARMTGFDATPPVVRNAPVTFRNVDDPHLVFINRPRGRFETVYAYGDDRPPLVVRGTTNRYGFRGAALPLERTGKRRVACLGDSYTFGEGVEDDETWPAQLERALARAAPERPHEVMNCGVNAYDTRQEVRLLETRVLPFSPDVVLLAFFLNDAAVRAEGRFAGVELGAPSTLHRVLTADARVAALRRWSRLADGLADRIVRREYLVFLGESRSRLYAQDSPGWRMARDELVRAKELCADRGIAFAVILYPLLFRTGDTLATHDAYAIVERHCVRHGIPVLDLEPAFLDRDVDRLRVHPADAHPNGEAHRIAAEEVAGFLEEEGMTG